MVQIRTRRHVCFATVAEGDAGQRSREACEAAFFGRLTAAHVETSMLAVNAAGWSLVVDEYDGEELRAAVRSLNLALRMRSRCARVTFVRHGNGTIPGGDLVLAALAQAGIAVVHLAAEAEALAVVVDERDASRTQTVLCLCAQTAPKAA